MREPSELELTWETLADLDEPEALLESLKRSAQRQRHTKWHRLAKALEAAQAEFERLEAKDKQDRSGE